MFRNKVCSSCKQELPVEQFYCDKNRKDGFYVYCRSCCQERQKTHRAKYKERLAIMEHKRNQTPVRKAQRRHYKQSKKFKERNRRYEKERRANNLEYKIKINLRGRLYHAIKDKTKGGSAVRDLGCSIIELKTYLEKQFQPGMTWDNWGLKGWHIDHIKPLSSFDLRDPKQVKQACRYTNLQPLWAKDNMLKGDWCV